MATQPFKPRDLRPGAAKRNLPDALVREPSQQGFTDAADETDPPPARGALDPRRKAPVRAGLKRNQGDEPDTAEVDVDYARGSQDEDADGDGLGQDDMDSDRLKAMLVEQVNQEIREAIQARDVSGIDDVWDEAKDLYEGVDEISLTHSSRRDNIPGKISSSKTASLNGRSRLLPNITQPKTDIGSARVQEMLVPHDDKPFEVKPTPIPELQDGQQMPDDDQPVRLGDGSMVPAKLVIDRILAKADENAKSVERWVDDVFTEANVYGELRKVIRDAARLGTGVLMGPVAKSVKERRWKKIPGTSVVELEIVEKSVPISKRVRIEDCYPAADCGDTIHDGSCFVYREIATAKSLRALAKVKGYDRACIAEAIKQGPMTYNPMAVELRRLTTEGDTSKDAKNWELWHWYGEISPSTLAIMMGDKAYDVLDEDDLYLTAVPAIVTMLNGKPLRVVANPMEEGGYPFDFFPWDTIDGQPWGRGIPTKMRVAQKIMTAATRVLMENTGLSAGPMIFIHKGRVTPTDGEWVIGGRKLYDWEASSDDGVDDIRKAVNVFDVPTRQAELEKIIQFALNLADQLTNLPMLLQGEQAAGTSPETLGGMKMLLNNATSPLRIIAKQYDDYLIVPHLNRYYQWGMEHGPDMIKGGDVHIKARGSTALVARDESREFLASLFPVIGQESLKINPAKWFAAFCRSSNFPATDIQYTDEEWKAEEQKRAQAPQQQDPRLVVAQMNNQRAAEVAKLNAQVAQSKLQFEQQDGEQDRALAREQMSSQQSIEQMRHDRESQKALDGAKVTLAGKTMDVASKNREMAFKATTSPDNQGI